SNCCADEIKTKSCAVRVERTETGRCTLPCCSSRQGASPKGRWRSVIHGAMAPGSQPTAWRQASTVSAAGRLCPVPSTLTHFAPPGYLLCHRAHPRHSASHGRRVHECPAHVEQHRLGGMENGANGKKVTLYAIHCSACACNVNRFLATRLPPRYCKD